MSYVLQIKGVEIKSNVTLYPSHNGFTKSSAGM